MSTPEPKTKAQWEQFVDDMVDSHRKDDLAFDLRRIMRSGKKALRRFFKTHLAAPSA